MKIITVIGARPQFIKAAVVSREIAKYSQIQEIIIHTGQHYDPNMSDIFFEEMEIPKPDYNLDIHSLSHGAMTGQMIEKIEELLIKEQPDWVLVYGDTNSTLAGALAAKKLHIKIAHIEAGLRSFNMRMPEEINRILTDRISDILFCPTATAVKNLENEGYVHIGTPIIECGDVMYDAALYYAQHSSRHSTLLSQLNLIEKPFILTTIHRQENTDDLDRLHNIFLALNTIHQTIPIVLPLHPRTRKMINHLKLSLNIIIIDPIGYFDMIELLKHAKMVITDSGGLQKEAYFFEKPCLTLRNETEWTELVTNGVNTLCDTDVSLITETAYALLTDRLPLFQNNLYGNGKAAKTIVETLLTTMNG